MWPSSIEFSEAIQNPFICFTDDDLKSGVPAIDKLGMPFVASGQFAAVFKLQFPNRAQAIRCFTRQLGDREKRYYAIDSHLDKYKDLFGIKYLTKYEYDPTGIIVRGQKYPILTMEWIYGNTLDVYIEDNLKNKDAVAYLAEEWVRLVAALKEANIAHGDLQHGNIIVQSDMQLRLVDLDGMYVPEMNGLKGCELGHRDYQHPQRNLNTFGLSLDNFSSLVIYVSLLAISKKPDVWSEFHDEGLILKQKDFKDPANSLCLRRISAIDSDMERLSLILRESCFKAPDLVPCLSDLVSVGSKSRLPIWMVAPAGSNISVRTREALNGVSSNQSNGNSGKIYPNSSPTNGSVKPTSVTPVVASNQNSTYWGYVFKGFLKFMLPWLILIGLNPMADGIWFWSIVYTILSFCYGSSKTKKSIQAPSKSQNGSGVSSKPATYCGTPNYVPVGSNNVNTRMYQAPLQASYSPPVYQSSSVATSKPANLVGSNIRFIYHRPSCKWAMRISRRNNVRFTTGNEARSNGYRACRVCSPPY